MVLGRDANNSKSASQITEHKKKSEPFAYRLWVRISTVWCGKRDLNPYGVNHTPLKRARLPVPPLPRTDDIIPQFAGFVNTYFKYFRFFQSTLTE